MALGQGAAAAMRPSAEIAALPGVAVNETLAAGLPAAVRSAGVLKVVTDLTRRSAFTERWAAWSGSTPTSPRRSA